MKSNGSRAKFGCHVNFAQDPLCSHFDECQKIKSISYIYIILGMLFIYLQLTENDVIGNK